MYPQILQDETKNAFLDINNSPLKNMPVICMKNSDGNRDGFVFKMDIQDELFIITDSTDPHTLYNYETIDKMLEDGWVVD